MKTLINLVLSAFLLFSAAPSMAMDHHAAHQSHECPMHPEVTGMQGDTCPKCGMDLEPAAKQGKAGYHCPMCPGVEGDKGDSCPKCGMDLEAKAGYNCPMHPEVTGQQGDSCPKCGMDLESTAQGQGQGHGHGHMKHHKHH
ncbi:heavy metal-binding domain-containing protein [Shewanella sp. GXUN23E]|uniref:heavy metal-binding domain-containing protein n=1 Tax=Shewanella sp. GXUN23E TaxID=3422498 RepID=UPI003D7E120E